MADLRTAANKFRDAGSEYWEATHKAGLNLGAVVWVEMTDGSLVIFTRGEYREAILRGVHDVGSQTVSFGSTGE